MYQFHDNSASSRIILCKKPIKKNNREAKGVPQSQTAANPRHQEEEKKDQH